MQHTPTENSPARARARQRKIQSVQSVDRGAADPLMVELSILDSMRKFKRQVCLDSDWELVFWNGGDVGSDGNGRDAR